MPVILLCVYVLRGWLPRRFCSPRFFLLLWRFFYVALVAASCFLSLHCLLCGYRFSLFLLMLCRNTRGIHWENDLLFGQLGLLLLVCLLCALCCAVVSLSFSTRSCCFGSLATASFDMCVSCANLICHLKIGLCLYVRYWLRELSFVFDYAYGYSPLSRFSFSCHCVAFLDNFTFVVLVLAVLQRVVACQLSRRYLLRRVFCSVIFVLCHRQARERSYWRSGELNISVASLRQEDLVLCTLLSGFFFQH